MFSKYLQIGIFIILTCMFSSLFWLQSNFKILYLHYSVVSHESCPWNGNWYTSNKSIDNLNRYIEIVQCLIERLKNEKEQNENHIQNNHCLLQQGTLLFSSIWRRGANQWQSVKGLISERHQSWNLCKPRQWLPILNLRYMWQFFIVLHTVEVEMFARMYMYCTCTWTFIFCKYC